ncbi:septal ring lytic transglycosylase RlpA family protein [Marinobacterium jannaschii]|uniref:septal ring lytic transglycosylase RlpA family protein n=1 Tax=Marinobacterium jannaschii TaxID=64970 RepID=UPI000484D9B6|nr:septal ring lytic transglycosylase RlpA family protein [Marinobacterium jannaschii]
MRAIVVVLTLIWLAGCSSKGGNGRYSVENDYGPDQPVDVSHVKDAVPRVEPKSRGGNPASYHVLGKTYYVKASASGYQEQGHASWYGKKFHGHKTSNGEVYDMYKMTAAHKTLPLPTYVRVTNQGNGRQVVVRVNDRGPFHPGRIIDLSYAAASKLGMLGAGTARVKVEAIDPRSWQKTSQVLAAAEVPVRDVSGQYLQVGAYASRRSAEQVQEKLQGVAEGLSVVIRPVLRGSQKLHRVQLGPLASDQQVRRMQSRLGAAGFPEARLVDLH